MALMVEFGNEAYIPNVCFVSLPVQSLSIANVFNGKVDSHGIGMTDRFDSFGPGGMVRYTFPGARLLVVDDIATNLKVAEGLLSPYQAVVDTCISGKEAIEQVKHQKTLKNGCLCYRLFRGRIPYRHLLPRFTH